MDLPVLAPHTARQCTYITKSRTGIYTFRWNLINEGTHHQPKLSLKTRDYVLALQIASTLALKIRELVKPTLEDIKRVYAEFRGETKKKSQLLSEIDIESFLSELSPKSLVEYRSCWNSFIASLEGKKVSVSGVSEQHIEKWKSLQKCSQTTLKKKLRLLSSSFNKVNLSHDPKWFVLAVKEKPVRSQRAMTREELNKVLSSTKSFKTKPKGYWKYYLPRIAALTGCRLNEICQLYVGDVKLGENPVLSINDNMPDKRLKNSSSEREIPIGRELMKLLIPLVAGRDSSERIFDDLPYNQSNGYNGAPSKYFSKLIKELKLEGVTFHSIRHYAVTKLFNEGVKEELIGSLVGHSVGKLTTGKVYMSGFNYNVKLAAIILLEKLEG
ncbi:recombinase [Vibrio parahaemolyticus]|uniref:site-specific integrase n=1 Tax=Vibrio parahaemolyticus TaxID=670 RepID=UPI0011228118|nr:site-specific integrase [Vibrio parahaemolyticus]TOK48255.1 recombinase [Vibrio parahaemolyticus]